MTLRKFEDQIMDRIKQSKDTTRALAQAKGKPFPTWRWMSQCVYHPVSIPAKDSDGIYIEGHWKEDPTSLAPAQSPDPQYIHAKGSGSKDYPYEFVDPGVSMHS